MSLSEPKRTTTTAGWLVKTAVVAAAYAGTAQLGFASAAVRDAVTPVWPPAGIAVAVIVLFGRGMWPAVALGAFVANVLNGASPPLAASIAVGNTIAPLIAAEMLRRADFRASLERLRDVVALVVAGGTATIVSSGLGIAALSMNGVAVTRDLWTVWWVGDALGVVLFAPLVLTLFANDGLLARRRWQAVVLLAALAIATGLAVVADSPVGYAVVPLAMAAAVQLEQQGAAFAALIMSGIDITHLVLTDPGGRTLDADVMAMHGVNATLALILLALATVMHERRLAQSRLESAAHDLERRVAERTEQLLRTNLCLETEIDERRLTEEALRASEERLAKAQRLAHIGSFQWDAATDVNDWSDELFKIYGLASKDGPPGFEEYLGFVRADVRGDVRASVDAAIASGEPLSHEYPIVLRDGTTKWVHAYIEILHDAGGCLSGLRGTCQDITERTSAEAALRGSEGRFRALLESAPDAVIVVDPTGKIVLSNKQTENILGYERDELLGRRLEMLLPDDLRAVHMEHRELYNAQPEGRPMGADRELYAQRKDGTRVAVDISLSPVETDGGFLVFALLRDASERRRVEDALRTTLDREREAAEDLRKLDRAKNAFLSAVSHELRTPLTAILGFAELLEEPNVRNSEEMTTDLVGRVRFSATRLNDLLGDLLDLDRLHRGIVEPRRRATSLRGLVVRALAGMELGPHPLSLHVDDAIVQIDPAQAERIVENLISNAVRYTPAGTNVYLRIAATADGGMDLVVSDEGSGVPKELWSTIFEPFVRGDTGTFTQGTGIGLALVDRFARLHGGSAEVGERAGGGACFRVVLPGPHEAAPEHLHAAVA